MYLYNIYKICNDTFIKKWINCDSNHRTSPKENSLHFIEGHLTE